MEEWDLTEVLVERPQPTDEVPVYLNEVASHAKVALMKAHSRATGEELERIDKELSEVEEALERSKYVIHLRGIPSRMREDINSKALSEFPMKLSVMGYDDPLNARERNARENLLLWHAQITNVVNPKGQSKKSWTLDEIEKFAATLPTAAQNIIDQRIKALTEASEKFMVESKNPDF